MFSHSQPDNPGSTPPPDRPNLTWTPLRLLTGYRVVLAAVLGVLFVASPTQRLIGADNPLLFGATCLAYLLFALAAGFAARLRRPRFKVQAVAQLTVDIAAVLLLMHASGGIDSGLGILLLIAVTAGALLLPGRTALFFAALASLGLLAQAGHEALHASFRPSEVTSAGLLGLSIFAATLVALVTARHVRATEALAVQRGIDLANLTRLNEQVIQHLQSGILVVDGHDRVRLMNATAARMLGADQPAGATLGDLCEPLHRQLTVWRQDPQWAPTPLPLEHPPRALLPRFSALGRDPGEATVVFLDDMNVVEHHSQQVKLAALGRLTAGIAHEIRNPLGAIGHAEQLLSESPRLTEAERRLTGIIRTNVARMNRMVEDVLQLSRRTPPHLRELDLGPWLQELATELEAQSLAPPTWVRLDVEPDIAGVHFDPDQLRQVLWNLYQNARQHGGGEDGTTELRIYGHRLPSGHVALDVEDNGAGVPDEMRERIFEPFYTSSSRGTGLGLYLAREICAANQACLDYRTQPGPGACFRITFDCSESSGPPVQDDGPLRHSA